jgi:hypothetical protein
MSDYVMTQTWLAPAIDRVDGHVGGNNTAQLVEYGRRK